MTITSVKDYVKLAAESEGLRTAQSQSAGAMIAQFLLVRDGLSGKVEDAEINAIAATLAVGIWSAKTNTEE